MGAGAQRRRTWLWAAGASVALHALVLLALAPWTKRPSPTTAAPAMSRADTLLPVMVLSPAGPSAGGRRADEVAAAPGEASSEVKPPRPPSRTSRHEAEAPKQTDVEAVEAASEVAPSEASAAPAAGGVGTEGGTGVGGEGVAAGVEAGRGVGARGPSGEGGAVGGGVTPDIAGLVHARLAAGAVRCYPPAARRFAQRGTATVRFCVDGQGAASAPAVVETSGSQLLDAAVGDCVLPRASPFPEAARGACFTAPVHFGAR